MLLLLTEPLLAAEARWPTDIPVNSEGIPTRTLNDDELYRLLLAHSARNEAISLLLTACHAAGTPYGHLGWRACLDQGRSEERVTGTR